MKIPYVVQSTTDIDWFAIDINGFVGHFSSQGSCIPENLPDSIEEVNAISQFMFELPFECEEIIPNPRIEDYVQFESRIGRKTYFEEFDEVVMRRLFAFDKTEPIDSDDHRFHLAASPGNPMVVDELPNKISEALKKMKFDMDFQKDYSVDVSEYL